MSTLARVAGSPVSEILDWLDSTQSFGPKSMARYIPVEDFTKEGKYVLRADLPGVDPEKDIDVSIDGDVLTISGQRREEEHDKGHDEVRYGSFSRSLKLPRGVQHDQVSARYESGVLEVTVPIPEDTGDSIKVPVERGDN